MVVIRKISDKKLLITSRKNRKGVQVIDKGKGNVQFINNKTGKKKTFRKSKIRFKDFAKQKFLPSIIFK